MKMKLLRQLAIATILLASVIVILMHFIETDFNPIFNYVSEYALGKYGWLASLSFSLFGISGIFLGKGLKDKKTEKYFLIAGTALIMVGIFHCDPKRYQLTASGTIHLVLTAIAAITAIFAIFPHLKKLDNSLLNYLFWIGLIAILVLVPAIIGDFSYAYHFYVPQIFRTLSNYAGLLERIPFFISIVLVLFLSPSAKLQK
jgi:hypothetical membrane protein